MIDHQAYDEGYKQALLDVSQFINEADPPALKENLHKKDFWRTLTDAADSPVNRFNIFVAGYRVAKNELRDRIRSLAKDI